MKTFEQPSIEFVSFGNENVIVTSCSGDNCNNPLGYGDLCVGGHNDCGTYVPPSCSPDLPL